MKPNFTLKPKPKSTKETKHESSSLLYKTNSELVVFTPKSLQDLVKADAQMGTSLKVMS